MECVLCLYETSLVVIMCVCFFSKDFDEDFPEVLLEQLPGALFVNTSDPMLAELLQALTENFEIKVGDSFNARRFLNSLIDTFLELLVRRITSSPSGRPCIRRIIMSEINQDAVDIIADKLEDIRRAITTLLRIGSFLERERRRLRNATPLEQCIDAFVDLAFCSRCIQRTPPLCLNTCNALIRGCYSPYYTALNQKYDRLWRVVRNVLTFVNSTVQDIFDRKRAIKDIASLVSKGRVDLSHSKTFP